MAKILTVPNPILRKKSKPVAKIDDKVLTLIKTLKSALNNAGEPKGVGLSAIQIGQPVRIFVVKIPHSPQPITRLKTHNPNPTTQVFINPKITWRSKKLTNGIPPSEDVKKENQNSYQLSAISYQLSNRPEGCLSIPGYYGIVRRHQSIKLKYTTIKNNQLSTINNQLFSNFLSTVIQHELDHLNGILFIDRVLEQGGKLYKTEDGKLVETSL